MTLHDVLHVILGAGGSIGTPLADELLGRGWRVRTVSRSGRGPAAAERVVADLTAADAVLRVIDRESVVYLTAGLKYDRRVWRTTWPAIMRNVVAACESRGARLIFFDNVYLYGATTGPMTEQTPVRPSSVKGRIRAEIVRFLEDEMAAGRLTAMIARAADFYGPYADATSVAVMLIIERLAAGKRAQVFADADTQHSYTYTLDCARALALLASTPDAYGQVWHLPTARPAPTGREFVKMAASALRVEPKLMVVPSWTIRAAGIFSGLMRELGEMLYQNDRDYVFDSTKFERRFTFVPTTYDAGIRETVTWLKDRRAGTPPTA